MFAHVSVQLRPTYPIIPYTYSSGFCQLRHNTCLYTAWATALLLILHTLGLHIISFLRSFSLSFLIFITVTFLSFCLSLVSIPVSVSTLQFKVSASQSNTSPTEYRQFRAHTLPSHSRLAPSPPSSSCSSSSSQERENISHMKDSSQKKAQQFSQLSTSLASAFSPVQPGGTLPSRNVRQIPLSPPTSRQSDSKDATWTSAHIYGPNSSSPQPVIPLNQFVHPTTSTQFDANSQLDHYYPFQTPFSKSASGPPPLLQYCSPDLSYPSHCKDTPLPGPCVQGHAHQPQFAASFCPHPPSENMPFSCSSVSLKTTPPAVSQTATAPSSK